MFNILNMKPVNIRNIDLNLLAVFAALAREKNVSRAARELHLTQSAVSHALGRLRETFGDPLFVRRPQGIVPTPKALEIEPQVTEILRRTQELFQPTEPFDPATYQGEFQITSTDYFELVALPRLHALLRKEAPGVTLISRPSASQLPRADLESGQCDVAVAGFYGEPPPGFHQQKLFSDEFVVMARKRHPRLKGRLTLAKYLAEEHIRIALHGNLKGEFDRHLESKGMHRRVVAGLSNFVSPAWVLCETDLLLTAPRKLAERYAEYLPVEIFPAPMEIGPVNVAQVWHQRAHADPFHKWMRAMIKSLFE